MGYLHLLIWLYYLNSTLKLYKMLPRLSYLFKEIKKKSSEYIVSMFFIFASPEKFQILKQLPHFKVLKFNDNHVKSDRKWTEIGEARIISEPLHKTGIIMADTSPTLTVGGDRTTGQSVRTQNGLCFIENIDWKFLLNCFVFLYFV